MSDDLTDTERRIYDQFVEGRRALQGNLHNLVNCATRLLETTTRGGRLSERDMEMLGNWLTEVLLSQGRQSLLGELVDAMDRV